MSEGGGKKKPLDIIDHMTEHLSSYDGRYLVIPGTAAPYTSYIPYLHQPFLYHRQIHPHYYAHRGYGGGETGGCLIENMVGNWSPDLSGTYSPFGGGAAPPPPQEAPVEPHQSVQPPDTPGSGSSANSIGPQPPAPRKQRIVAEVKPLRPSYSDVVSKCSGPPLSPITKTAPPTSIKTPVQPTATKEPRPKPVKQATQPNNFSHQGSGKDVKKECQSEEISETKRNKKNQADWSEGKAQDIPNKQSKSNSQQTTKKNKQNKQPVREEKAKCGVKGIGCGKNQGAYYASLSQTKKYGGVSDDEEVEEKDEEKSDDEERERSPAPRDKLHQDVPSRKHPGVKVERAVNPPRAPGKSKRSQRASKRKENKLSLLCKKWQEKSSYYLLMIASWLFNLLVDVAAMSAALLVQLGEVVIRTVVEDARWLMGWVRARLCRGYAPAPPLHHATGPSPLQHNIVLPATGEEAMKRLLSCKGKDPYSILGLTSGCTDEDIRRYYRSQALLVHPDKNSQPGAEEAFKILVHAFDLIAEPEKRAAYDRYVSETNQVEQAWSELSDLLTQLHEKMHYAATTIRCNNCGKRHKRTLTERPVYAARYCAQCNIHHSAKEGDMWCEVGRWVFSRRYLACMEGSVYEITEWARCQGGGLVDLVPHSHSVHYRVLLGGVDKNRHPTTGDNEFEDLLSSIYGQGGNQARHRMNNRRKGKKSK